ncbi:hypothetical protein M758_2G131700 [Ceratodon purpureus]|nr:hypothetical protein M758_2G131700 [Ceratodon purpureus]
MASLVSSVCRASSGAFLSPCDSRAKCSVSQPRAELVPSVSSSGVRRQQLGLGQECCFATAPAFGRRGPRLSSVRRRAGGDDDQPKKPDAGSNESKFDDTVNDIERALGKSFGGTLWFAILLTLLAVFGGGYVYLVYNYADFSDIPILNGPKGL